MSAQYPQQPYGPGPEVMPSAQPQSRGCATAGVVAAALVLVVLAAGAIWYVVTRDSPETGEYESAPECAAVATDTLDALVPGHELELEEPLGAPEDPGGSGWQCRWATPEGPGDAVPATATLVLVAAPNPGGVTTAADNLRATTEQHETTGLDGVGEEAVRWTAGAPFTVGCVGTRVSNLYVESCYTAATDYDAVGSVEGADAAEDAELLARAVVEQLPDPEAD